MANLELLIAAWDECHREFPFALEGLPDEDVWKRPHPNLLSIGELAGHMAYWEAVRFTGPGPNSESDLSLVKTKSPLVDKAFRYYTGSIGEPVDLGLSGAEVLAEIERIHAESKAGLTAVEHDSEELVPGSEKATWGFVLNYQIFHIAYHTGQAYSVRHLLGHTTTDN